VLDSLIPSFVLPEDGRYFIVATSCCTGGSSGTYELILDLLDRSARRIEYAGAIGYREQVSAELMPDVAAHVWEFEGEAGDEISVAMNALSEELDPFLLLLAMGEPLETGELTLEEYFSLSEDELADLVAAADERGVLLNFNDDRDEGVLDSLIPSFVLPEDGRYFIIATSCCTGESSGPYELILDLLDRSPRRIEYAGAIGYQEQVSAELTPDVVAHVWEFEGEAGDEISVAMNALSEELDPFLLLLAMGEQELEEFLSLSEDELADLVAAADERGVLLNFNDDRDEGGLDSLIPSFVLPEDGRYFIVATSCCTGGSSGPYELILDLLDRSARRIEYAGAIGYQEQVSAELMPDVVAHVWEFEGEAGDEISVAMNALSEELDPFLPLLIMGEQELEEFLSLSEDELADLVAAADERGVLLNFNDDRDEGVPDSLIPSFVLPEDGRYFIVATSCCTGESSGPYELILDIAGAEEPDDAAPDDVEPDISEPDPGEPDEPSPGEPGGDDIVGAPSLLLPIIVGGAVLLGLMFGAGMLGLVVVWRMVLRQKRRNCPQRPRRLRQRLRRMCALSTSGIRAGNPLKLPAGR
jgi:hypothetical protein